MNEAAHIVLIARACYRRGFKSKEAIAAIVAVCYKESGIKPTSELSYAGSSWTHVVEVFGKRPGMYEAWKKGEPTLTNFLYKGVAGNGPLDGYKYRGSGYNQLTGKSNYVQLAEMTGHPIDTNPGLMANPNVAADVVAAFFERAFRKMTGIPGSLEDWYSYCYAANAGSREPEASHKDNPAYAKGLARLPGIMAFLNS